MSSITAHFSFSPSILSQATWWLPACFFVFHQHRPFPQPLLFHFSFSSPVPHIFFFFLFSLYIQLLQVSLGLGGLTSYLLPYPTYYFLLFYSFLQSFIHRSHTRMLLMNGTISHKTRRATGCGVFINFTWLSKLLAHEPDRSSETVGPAGITYEPSLNYLSCGELGYFVWLFSWETNFIVTILPIVIIFTCIYLCIVLYAKMHCVCYLYLYYQNHVLLQFSS